MKRLLISVLAATSIFASTASAHAIDVTEEWCNQAYLNTNGWSVQFNMDTPTEGDVDVAHAVMELLEEQRNDLPEALAQCFDKNWGAWRTTRYSADYFRWAFMSDAQQVLTNAYTLTETYTSNKQKSDNAVTQSAPAFEKAMAYVAEVEGQLDTIPYDELEQNLYNFERKLRPGSDRVTFKKEQARLVEAKSKIEGNAAYHAALGYLNGVSTSPDTVQYPEDVRNSVDIYMRSITDNELRQDLQQRTQKVVALVSTFQSAQVAARTELENEVLDKALAPHRKDFSDFSGVMVVYNKVINLSAFTLDDFLAAAKVSGLTVEADEALFSSDITVVLSHQDTRTIIKLQKGSEKDLWFPIDIDGATHVETNLVSMSNMYSEFRSRLRPDVSDEAVKQRALQMVMAQQQG